MCKNKPKFTPADFRAIAEFHRIIKNYLKMVSIKENDKR